MFNITGLLAPAWNLITGNNQKEEEDINDAELFSLIDQIEDSSTEAIESSGNQSNMSKRPKLSKLLYGNMKLHHAVESSPFVLKLRSENASEVDYLNYLHKLHYDVKIIETSILTYKIPHADLLDLKKFFRSKALASDIANDRFLTCSVVKDSEFVKRHGSHFVALSKQNPIGLLAHAALRYLAILHGGQQRAKRLKEMWGEHFPTNLYTFKDEHGNEIDPESVCGDLTKQLDAYGEALTAQEFKAFKKELIIAWIYSGDVLGTNIRPIVKQLKSNPEKVNS